MAMYCHVSSGRLANTAKSDGASACGCCNAVSTTEVAAGVGATVRTFVGLPVGPLLVEEEVGLLVLTLLGAGVGFLVDIMANNDGDDVSAAVASEMTCTADGVSVAIGARLVGSKVGSGFFVDCISASVTS